MKNPFKIIDQKLRKKYWYSETTYQWVKGGLIGWSIAIPIYIAAIIKHLV